MTTELEMAKNGEFLREYGKQYFVAVSEALNIGRVKWNMVPIGGGGKNDIAFYLTTEQMLALCNEIKSGMFAKKMDKEKADGIKYPSAYKYATGEDASLNLNIGSGNVGCRVQMRDTKANLNYTMAVSMDAMRDMMYKYLLCTGMTPVVPNSYYASVIDAFEEGRKDRAKFRKNPPAGLTDVKNMNTPTDDDEDKVVEQTSAPTNAETTNVSETQNVKDEVFTVSVSGPKMIKGDFYAFTAKVNDEDVVLTFKKEIADKLAWFAKFENSVTIEPMSIKIFGEKNGKFILYKGAAK